MSLRNWLDKLRPQFEEGGKWHAFKSIYDGMDTFLYVPNETSKSGTSIHDAIDSKKLALDFANYGLSITPKIASVPKNFFKAYIRSGEVLK